MQTLLRTEDRIGFSESQGISLSVEIFLFHYLCCRSAISDGVSVKRGQDLFLFWYEYHFMYWIVSSLSVVGMKRRESVLIREGSHDVFNGR